MSGAITASGITYLIGALADLCAVHVQGSTIDVGANAVEVVVAPDTTDSQLTAYYRMLKDELPLGTTLLITRRTTSENEITRHFSNQLLAQVHPIAQRVAADMAVRLIGVCARANTDELKVELHLGRNTTQREADAFLVGVAAALPYNVFKLLSVVIEGQGLDPLLEVERLGAAIHRFAKAGG